MGLFVIDLTHRLAEHAGRSTIKYIFMLLNHGGTSIRKQCLSQDLDFFPKKELFKFFRELFAKERSYPSTTKLHDEARKQVRSSYITCTEYTKQNIVPS